jgi:predicted ATPase
MPDLLASAFPTRWCVITGAPCAGKTTIVTLLERRGALTVAEASRSFLNEELAKGRTIAELRANDAEYQRTMVRRKQATERSLDPQQLAFLDRGMPDSISYFRKAGLDPEQARRECFTFRYAKIFLFERLPLVGDSVRTEDEVLAARLEQWLAEDYAAIGYEVTRVPVMSIDERLTFVLEATSALARVHT